MKVIFKIKDKEFADLTTAMDYAKTLNEFVTIHGPEFEVCGKFGVDEVKDPNYDGWISRKQGI